MFQCKDAVCEQRSQSTLDAVCRWRGWFRVENCCPVSLRSIDEDSPVERRKDIEVVSLAVSQEYNEWEALCPT